MSNPFKVKGTRDCDECGKEVTEVDGEMMYFHNGDFICEDCAGDQDVVCECGNYKKEQYPTCYDCRNTW